MKRLRSHIRKSNNLNEIKLQTGKTQFELGFYSITLQLKILSRHSFHTNYNKPAAHIYTYQIIAQNNMSADVLIIRICWHVQNVHFTDTMFTRSSWRKNAIPYRGIPDTSHMSQVFDSMVISSDWELYTNLFLRSTVDVLLERTLFLIKPNCQNIVLFKY